MTSQLVKLSEICRIESGGTPSSDNSRYWNGDINWVTLVDVKNKYVTSTKRKITTEGLKNSSAKLLPIGTVLFSSRATIGEVSIANVELATNQGFKNFICDLNKVIPEYLYFILRFEAKKIANSISSTTFKEISKSKLSEYKIPLCSIEEQKIIVKELNFIESLRQKRKTATDLLDSYLITVFYEMFGDPTVNSKRWRIKTLQDLTTKLGDGLHGTPIYDESGDYYFINGNNLEDGKITLKNSTKRVSQEEFEKYKKPLNENSILVSINGTLGKVAFYHGEKIILGKSACYFNIKREEIDSLYLYFILKSDYFAKYATSNSTGSTIQNVSLKTMRNFPLMLPPFSLQKEFAEMEQKVESVKHKMSLQSEELEKQFRALTQKSFAR